MEAKKSSSRYPPKSPVTEKQKMSSKSTANINENRKPVSTSYSTNNVTPKKSNASHDSFLTSTKSPSKIPVKDSSTDLNKSLTKNSNKLPSKTTTRESAIDPRRTPSKAMGKDNSFDTEKTPLKNSGKQNIDDSKRRPPPINTQRNPVEKKANQGEVSEEKKSPRQSIVKDNFYDLRKEVAKRASELQKFIHFEASMKPYLEKMTTESASYQQTCEEQKAKLLELDQLIKKEEEISLDYEKERTSQDVSAKVQKIAELENRLQELLKSKAEYIQKAQVTPLEEEEEEEDDNEF